MTAQLGLGFATVTSPLASREKRLRRIVGVIHKAQGEHDFYDDHIVTFEIARRLRQSVPKTALDLAELRRRGVVNCHDHTIASEFREARAMAWYLDESPRPRPYKRRPASLLPVRLDS